jgi:hypothetical protein
MMRRTVAKAGTASGAAVLGGAVELLEGLEELVGVGGVEAGAAVADAAADAGPGDGMTPNSMAASPSPAVYFQALSSRLASAVRIRTGPAVTRMPSFGHPDPAAGVDGAELVPEDGDHGAEDGAHPPGCGRCHRGGRRTPGSGVPRTR